MTLERCLWHADDGRCILCKAKRVKQLLKIPDYEICVKDRDYNICDFYKSRPSVLKWSKKDE